eukprot:16803-Eustigmatos_ZCMA.PRE.1
MTSVSRLKNVGGERRLHNTKRHNSREDAFISRTDWSTHYEDSKSREEDNGDRHPNARAFGAGS